MVKNKFFLSPVLVLIGLLIVQIIIFSPQVNRGFVNDDLTWLENVVPDGKIDYLRPFSKTTGFFRPIVGITFGLQYQLYGMDARPYGLFNLFLHLLNIILVFLLLSYWKKTKPYAIWATLLFALNAKGVNMAVGWISGRTTLLFAFFLLLTLYLYAGLPKKNPLRYLLTALAYFAALLSKETAAAAPIFIFFFVLFDFNGEAKTNSFVNRVKSGLISIAVFVPPLIAYFLLRFNSDAMLPFTAPDVYRYSFSPLLILKNLSEYIVRAGLLDLYIIIVFLLIMAAVYLFKKAGNREKETFNLQVFACGVLWFLIFLLPLLPIPARSDLYVYLPQVGLHIAALTVLASCWKSSPPRKGWLRYTAFFLIGLLAAGWVGYLFSKAVPIGEKGEASAGFSEQVVLALHDIPAKSTIIIIDKHHSSKNSPSKVIAYGFHSLLNLYYPDKKLTGKIFPPEKIIGLKNKPGTYVFSYEDNFLKQIE
ncbi:hypothetical protein ACFLRB_02900 [Acidobacteriota bacterium]